MAQQLSVGRDKTAVLIMDYQNRQLNSLPEEVRKGILSRANEVLAKARHEGIPVIYVERVSGARTPENATHPDIAPKAGEKVLAKQRIGPFSTTDLDNILKKQGVDTLVLMGINTSGCILTTVRCASDMDYKLIVLSDCCADHDDEIHHFIMEKLLPRQATVVTSQEFIRVLNEK